MNNIELDLFNKLDDYTNRVSRLIFNKVPYAISLAVSLAGNMSVKVQIGHGRTVPKSTVLSENLVHSIDAMFEEPVYTTISKVVISPLAPYTIDEVICDYPSQIKLGMGISSDKGSGGTICAFVHKIGDDREKYILSCDHILTDRYTNIGQLSIPTCQPPIKIDCDKRRIGALSERAIFYDAALSKLCDGFNVKNITKTKNSVVSDVEYPKLHSTVFKEGYNTGFTEGVVGAHVRIRGSQSRFFYIKPKNAACFASNGDSGSPIICNKSLVGLLAKKHEIDNKVYGLAVFAKDVFDHFNIKLI